MLAEYIGKDMAKKIEEMPWTPYQEETARGEMITQDHKVLSGLDLKVGGDGMQAFYDQILPSEVNKYVKKWGGQISKASIQTGDLSSAEDAAREYHDMSARAWRQMGRQERNEYINDYLQSGEGGAQQPSIDITDSMRSAALAGQPAAQAAAPEGPGMERALRPDPVHAPRRDERLEERGQLGAVHVHARLGPDARPRVARPDRAPLGRGDLGRQGFDSVVAGAEGAAEARRPAV
jgi:hypothetical protein